VAGDLVGTATTAVRLGGVRPEGKAAMPAADWLRGLRLSPGERFA
jgi:methionyl-tRNA formyltransferase